MFTTLLSAFKVAKVAGNIGPLIQKYWKLIAVLIMLGLAYLYWKDMRNTIHDQQEQIVSLEKKLTECGTNSIRDITDRKNLENRIEEYTKIIAKKDKSITDFKRQVEALSIGLGSADVKVKANKEHTAKTVNGILSSEAPKDCSASINYLVDGIGELKW